MLLFEFFKQKVRKGGKISQSFDADCDDTSVFQSFYLIISTVSVKH